MESGGYGSTILPGFSSPAGSKARFTRASSAATSVREAASPDPAVYLNDPLVVHVVRTSGRPRVYRDRALHEQFEWGRTPTWRLLEQAGVSDRMVGVHPVSADTEVFVSVDAMGCQRAIAQKISSVRQKIF